MFCPHCGKEIPKATPFVSSAADLSRRPCRCFSGRPKTAWEDPSTQWTVQGLLSSLKDVLFAPTKFFRTMNVAGDHRSMLFALITAW